MLIVNHNNAQCSGKNKKAKHHLHSSANDYSSDWSGHRQLHRYLVIWLLVDVAEYSAGVLVRYIYQEINTENNIPYLPHEEGKYNIY